MRAFIDPWTHLRQFRLMLQKDSVLKSNFIKQVSVFRNCQHFVEVLYSITASYMGGVTGTYQPGLDNVQ
jgi:hypothetical protein